MPAKFDACVSGGGKVRTKSLPNGKYIHICFLKGKSYAGYVKTKVKKSKFGVSDSNPSQKSTTSVGI